MESRPAPYRTQLGTGTRPCQEPLPDATEASPHLGHNLTRAQPTTGFTNKNTSEIVLQIAVIPRKILLEGTLVGLEWLGSVATADRTANGWSVRCGASTTLHAGWRRVGSQLRKEARADKDTSSGEG